MKRVILFLLLLVNLAFGCAKNFESCLQKVQDYHVVHNKQLFIPITKTKMLVYSQQPLKKFLSYDKFLNLYLVDSNKTLHYPFKLNKYLPTKNLAFVADNAIKAKLKPTKDKEFFSYESTNSQTPSLLLNGCCELVGIATPKGVISKEFIGHFLKTKNGYGSFGCRFQSCTAKKAVVVSSTNPFVQTPLKVGDQVVFVSGTKITSLSQLNTLVLFSTIGSTKSIKVIRCNKPLELTLKVLQRDGGGFISDTYLERFGIKVDAQLFILQTKNKTLQKGDKIVMIGTTKVNTQTEVQTALSKADKTTLLGINRKGLLFFLPLESL